MTAPNQAAISALRQRLHEMVDEVMNGMADPNGWAKFGAECTMTVGLLNAATGEPVSLTVGVNMDPEQDFGADDEGETVQ